jgi:hypothetical protein
MYSGKLPCKFFILFFYNFCFACKSFNRFTMHSNITLSFAPILTSIFADDELFLDAEGVDVDRNTSAELGVVGGANRILCIPATSAPSKCVFSTAGLTIAKDKAWLASQMATDYLHDVFPAIASLKELQDLNRFGAFLGGF